MTLTTASPPRGAFAGKRPPHRPEVDARSSYTARRNTSWICVPTARRLTHSRERAANASMASRSTPGLSSSGEQATRHPPGRPPPSHRRTRRLRLYPGRAGRPSPSVEASPSVAPPPRASFTDAPRAACRLSSPRRCCSPSESGEGCWRRHSAEGRSRRARHREPSKPRRRARRGKAPLRQSGRLRRRLSRLRGMRLVPTGLHTSPTPPALAATRRSSQVMVTGSSYLSVRWAGDFVARRFGVRGVSSSGSITRRSSAPSFFRGGHRPRHDSAGWLGGGRRVPAPRAAPARDRCPGV